MVKKVNDMLIYDQIQKKAISLIKKHKTNDPKQILKERGVHLIAFKSDTKLLGMYTVIKRNRFVFYNPNLTDTMKKMVFAHELGHDILHRSQLSSNSFHEFELFDVNSLLETEANLFACHLLIDEEELQTLGSQGYTYDQIASKLRININLLLFKIAEMNRKGKRYTLSSNIDNKFFSTINKEKLKNYED